MYVLRFQKDLAKYLLMTVWLNINELIIMFYELKPEVMWMSIKVSNLWNKFDIVIYLLFKNKKTSKIYSRFLGSLLKYINIYLYRT